MGSSRATAQSRIQVPDGCGSELEFRNEVERLTGSPAAEAALSSLRIDALPGEGTGYELRLVVGDEVRVLSDPQCRILWRSAVVIVAAAAKGEPGAEPSEPPELPVSPDPPSSSPAEPPPPPRRASPDLPSPSPAQPPRPAGAAPPARVEAPERVSRPARRASATVLAEPALGVFRPGLALGIGVSGGVLPDLGSVLDASARAEVLPWAFDVSVRYWPRRSETREGRGVDISALGVRIAGLYRVASALNLIAGIEVNRLVGEGTEGVSGRNTDAVWHWAPTLGFSLITWDISDLRLEIGAAGRLSVLRPRFVVTGFGDVYRVPALGADAIIRGVWLFR